MTPCNAEYNESGNADKHTHHCVRDSSQVNFTHLCACGHIWADGPAKPESRCTCSIELDCYPDGSSLDREYRYIVRCSHCLNQDAEVQRLAAIGDKWKQYANDVTDAKNAEIQRLKADKADTHGRLERAVLDISRKDSEIQRLEAELEQKMTPQTQRMQAEIQRLKEDVAINDDFMAALENKVESLSAHGTCACDYDRPGDVCAHHSPKLIVSQAEIARLTNVVADRGELIQIHTREIQRLTQELAAATKWRDDHGPAY